MKHTIRVTRFSAIATAALALVACGGGGGDSPPAPPASAEGAYAGSLSNSPSATAFQAVVLEDGQLWALYGNVSGGIFLVNGLLQGNGSSSNGSYTTSNLRDFGSSPAAAASLSATYTTAPTLVGTIGVSGVSIGINGSGIPTATFNYNTPASLASIAGAWTLGSTTGDTVSLSIAPNGGFTATTALGCSFSGTATPRPSGRNVYNVTATFGAAPCALAGQTVTGIGLYSVLTPTNRQLMVALVDGTRSVGTVAIGSR